MNGVVLFFFGGVAMWHLEMASGVRGQHHGWGGISETTLAGFKVGHLVLSFDAKNAVQCSIAMSNSEKLKRFLTPRGGQPPVEP